MLKSRVRVTSCFLWVMLTFLGFYPSSPAKADVFTTTGPDDYYFTLDAGTTFTVRTYAWQYGIDSQLWLYNNEGTVVAVNDDYYYLDSYISYAVQNTGTYRLRTSVCCGDPNRWYGTSYVVDTSSAPTNAPPTTTTSTTTTTTTTTTSTTTTTTIPRTIGAPRNLTVTETTTGVDLTWDAPNTGNYEPERYAVTWSGSNGGRAVASTNTYISLSYNTIFSAGDSGETFSFNIRSDNDTESLYSTRSNTVDVQVIRFVPTNKTSTTSTTTTTLAPTTPTTSTTTTTSSTTTTTTEPPTTTVLPTTTSTTSTTVPETTTTISPVTGTTSTSTTTLAPVPTTTTTSTSTTSTVLPTTTTTTTVPPVQELVQVDPEVTALLGAINNLPQSEIAAAVDNIIEQGVSADEATALATNPEVLQSVTSEQATEIFAAVEVSNLSDAQADQLIEAVQNAPEEVKAAFEEQINIFGGKFNKYVPIGSKINVGQRKVLVAATGVLFMAPVVPVSSSSSGSQSSDNKSRGKK